MSASSPHAPARSVRGASDRQLETNSPSGDSVDSEVNGPSRDDLLRFHQKHYAVTRKVRDCRRNPVPAECGGTGNVEIHKREDGATHFSGLQKCNNPYRCAKCAIRRAREDALEIQGAINLHFQRGGDALLVTWTLPHKLSDRLGELRKQVQDAYRYSLEGRQWRKLAEELDYTGLLVKSHEITVGPSANGWHPHIHAILLFDRSLQGVERERIETVLYQRWAKRLVKKHGRARPSREYGVRVVRGENAGEYVAKLGLGREISSMAVKEGRQASHLTPFQLLARLYEKRDRPRGERGQLEDLWEEYVRETKGKHLLNWGRTEAIQALRERIKDQEVESAESSSNDDAPGESSENSTDRVATLTRAAWGLVRRNTNRPSDLLRVAQRFGWPGVRRTLQEYGRKSPGLRVTIDEHRRRIDAYRLPGGGWTWEPD